MGNHKLTFTIGDFLCIPNLRDRLNCNVMNQNSGEKVEAVLKSLAAGAVSHKRKNRENINIA